MADQATGFIDTEVGGRVVPLTIETHTLIAPDQLAKNIAINLARSVPRFHLRPGFMSCNKEPIAIVAGGPSLKETIEQVRDFKNILVCGSTHDYVVRQGIVPTFAVVSDGGEEDKGNLSLPQMETTYLLASQCAPNLFEHLAGHKIEMWHYRGQATPDPVEEAKLLNGEPAITWGSTVTLSAIHIALLMGHQDLHFFGFDSCYGDYGLAHHCSDIAGGIEYQKVPITVGPKKKSFISDFGLLTQAEQFFRLLEMWGVYFNTTIHGGGLIAEMVRQGDPGLSEYVSLA